MSPYPRGVLSPRQVQALRTKALASSLSHEEIFALISSHEQLRARALVKAEALRHALADKERLLTVIERKRP
jgi:hypothetical protein